MERNDFIIHPAETILVTGASGFIGLRLAQYLLSLGFRNVRCFVRSASKVNTVQKLASRWHDDSRVQVFTGNLLSREDCLAVTKDVSVTFHLAAGRGEKSFPEAFTNSVVTTRNLLEATLHQGSIRRFVNVSSFSVYTNAHKLRWRVLDESCAVETHPEDRADAYRFAKVKQDELVTEYAKKFGIPLVIVRPGYVFGPGNQAISGRVGTGAFGFFLHFGGSNQIPLTYVDNCAEAIALAGLKRGIDGETFNVVDDDLPSSRHFLRLYKANVRPFKSLYLPHALSYLFCYLWERYSVCSERQLEPVFNRKTWHAMWKKTRYSNEKLKSRTGWLPKVSMADALDRYFESCRGSIANA
jgi:nucleoside-diphosphate-sugar epimerase